VRQTWISFFRYAHPVARSSRGNRKIFPDQKKLMILNQVSALEPTNGLVNLELFQPDGDASARPGIHQLYVF
jgi:hypothetical protein